MSFRLTYATMFNPPEELHERFEKALVKMRTMVKRIEDQFLAPLDDSARAALHDAVLQIAANQDRRFQQPLA